MIDDGFSSDTRIPDSTIPTKKPTEDMSPSVCSQVSDPRDPVQPQGVHRGRGELPRVPVSALRPRQVGGGARHGWSCRYLIQSTE